MKVAQRVNDEDGTMALDEEGNQVTENTFGIASNLGWGAAFTYYFL